MLLQLFFCLGFPWNYLLLKLFYGKEIGSLFALLLLAPLTIYTFIGIGINIGLLVATILLCVL